MNEVCANISSAAATLSEAIGSGGDGANQAAMASLFSCPGDVRLDLLMFRVVWPVGGRDWQRSLE